MSIFTNKSKRVEALRTVSIFEGLPKKDVQMLESHCTPLTLEEGAVLAEEGRAPQQMFLIVEGEAVVRRNKRKIATVGAGDTVGELSLLDGGKQTATVTATTSCDVLVVAANEFRVMLEDSPGFMMKVLKSTAGRLRDATSQIV